MQMALMTLLMALHIVGIMPRKVSPVRGGGRRIRRETIYRERRGRKRPTGRGRVQLRETATTWTIGGGINDSTDVLVFCWNFAKDNVSLA